MLHWSGLRKPISAPCNNMECTKDDLEASPQLLEGDSLLGKKGSVRGGGQTKPNWTTPTCLSGSC
eukprot:1159116-Pelagomonas_calceolata.AAC.9